MGFVGVLLGSSVVWGNHHHNFWRRFNAGSKGSVQSVFLLVIGTVLLMLAVFIGSALAFIITSILLPCRAKTVLRYRVLLGKAALLHQVAQNLDLGAISNITHIHILTVGNALPALRI
jgi:hypothetical protein